MTDRTILVTEKVEELMMIVQNDLTELACQLITEIHESTDIVDTTMRVQICSKVYQAHDIFNTLLD